jgi:hypothetical protein
MLLRESDRRSINLSALNRSKRRNPRGSRYSAAELHLVKTHYPDYKTIMRVLPGRGLNSVKGAAARYGIVKRRHVWTNQEVTRLRKMYPTSSFPELLAAFPQVIQDQIYGKAQHLGLVRRKPALVLTGCPMHDAIRARARALNLTMADLDAMIGSKWYFQRSHWRARFNYARACAAVRALNGKVGVIWD